MKVVEIRSEGDFRELRTAWNDLLSLSSGASTFLTWEWTWAWWSAYGVPGELRILAISDDQGVLRGIAPLRCGTAKRYGQKVAALSFLADGSNDSGCRAPYVRRVSSARCTTYLTNAVYRPMSGSRPVSSRATRSHLITIR